MSERPRIRLRPGVERAIARGLPWVYERQVDWDPAAAALPPGSIVDVLDSQGQGVATASLQPGVPIALRCWGSQAGLAIDRTLLEGRIRRALALRDRCLDRPWYRLLHADADGLPGVVCDRFDDLLVLEVGDVAAGIQGPLVEAVMAVLAPRSLLVRGGGEDRIIGSPLPPLVEVPEGRARFLADLSAGQKTGWYYDQRPHRAFVHRCAQGARVLDAFCYSGGFAIQAALGGATEVLAMDRSAPALALAAQASALNGVADRLRFERAELLEALPAMASSRARFDLVTCDPPPLARHRAKRGAALQAHRHLARSAAALLDPGGILLQASCSHAVSGERFLKALLQGLSDAGRTGTLIHRGGAGPDHPVHPMLPQSAYLDVVGLRVV
jgi:23S rRNA (cytosine1962-C5)-methyltransferase